MENDSASPWSQHWAIEYQEGRVESRAIEENRKENACAENTGQKEAQLTQDGKKQSCIPGKHQTFISTPLLILSSLPLLERALPHFR